MLGVRAFAGYAANAEQGEVSLRAIHALMTLAPIGIMIVMIVAARAYRLDETAHQEIVKALSQGHLLMGVVAEAVPIIAHAEFGCYAVGDIIGIAGRHNRSA